MKDRTKFWLAAAIATTSLIANAQAGGIVNLDAHNVAPANAQTNFPMSPDTWNVLVNQSLQSGGKVEHTCLVSEGYCSNILAVPAQKGSATYSMHEVEPINHAPSYRVICQYDSYGTKRDCLNVDSGYNWTAIFDDTTKKWVTVAK